MDDSMIYLDTYVLQKDMRVRLPKPILTNLRLEKGVSRFDIYYRIEDKSIVLKVCEDDADAARAEG